MILISASTVPHCRDLTHTHTHIHARTHACTQAHLRTYTQTHTHILFLIFYSTKCLDNQCELLISMQTVTVLPRSYRFVGGSPVLISRTLYTYHMALKIGRSEVLFVFVSGWVSACASFVADHFLYYHLCLQRINLFRDTLRLYSWRLILPLWTCC